MNEEYKFNFVYTVTLNDSNSLYSVCCYDGNGRKIKTIYAIGEKRINGKLLQNP